MVNLSYVEIALYKDKGYILNRMENEAQELWRIAYTDELTGLYNRRYLKLNVRGTIQSLKDRNEPLCLLIMDIDKFKGVNDTYGHLAGDEVLKGFASILKELSDKDAIPIRYAGDEFCVVIPGYDKRKGKDFGEKLVKLMEQTPLSITENKKVTVSTSVGVASIPKDASTYEDLFKRADEALYKAKELGRAQTVVFPDDGQMIAPDLVTSLFPIKELIGREEETKILLDYLDGRSKMVPVVSGNFGMGKTFLMNWVEDKARQASMQVIYVSGHPFWKFQPLSALFSSIAIFRENNADLFDSILDSIEEEQRKALQFHLNIKNAEQEKAFSPELISESIRSFFTHIFKKGKTVLILDDIQKIDEDTIRFFNSLLEQFMEKVLSPFIVIEKLPDDITSVLEFISLMPYLEDNIQFLELNPLSEAECDRFITTVLTHNPFPESFQKIIYSNTNGKPLFIQELLKNLLNSRKVIYSIDHWELADCSEADLAISLEHIAENRVKLLDDELQDVLSKAALIGDSFDLPLLSKLSGHDENDLGEVLRKGESAYIIIEGSGHEGDFSFINPHEKQALLNLIDKEEQKKMHGKIVALENATHGGDTRRIMGRLMYHLNKGFLFRQASELIRETPSSLIGSQVSTSSLEKLQKSSFKKIAAKEEALSPDALRKSLTTIRNIKIAINNLRLYPKSNENVRQSIERVFEDIEYFLTMTEAFSISSTPEMILVNGSEPHSSDLGNLPIEIYTLLNEINLKGITFISVDSNMMNSRIFSNFHRRSKAIPGINGRTS
jgi:diguanylate cyclase (GGDEF)-like protein